MFSEDELSFPSCFLNLFSTGAEEEFNTCRESNGETQGKIYRDENEGKKGEGEFFTVCQPAPQPATHTHTPLPPKKGSFFQAVIQQY